MDWMDIHKPIHPLGTLVWTAACLGEKGVPYG